MFFNSSILNLSVTSNKSSVLITAYKSFKNKFYNAYFSFYKSFSLSSFVKKYGVPSKEYVPSGF